MKKISPTIFVTIKNGGSAMYFLHALPRYVVDKIVLHLIGAFAFDFVEDDL